MPLLFVVFVFAASVAYSEDNDYANAFLCDRVSAIMSDVVSYLSD